MPEVARCNTIEVGEPVLRADSKIEACDQVKQTLKKRDPRPRQAKVPRQKLRSSCRLKSSATGTRPVAWALPLLKVASFCWKVWKVLKPSCCSESHEQVVWLSSHAKETDRFFATA